MCDLLVNDDNRGLPPGRLCELFGAGGEHQTIVTSLTRAVATGGTCLQISVQKSQHFGMVVPDRLSSEHSASPRNSWVGLRHRPAGLSRALPAKATADAALRTATEGARRNLRQLAGTAPRGFRRAVTSPRQFSQVWFA